MLVLTRNIGERIVIDCGDGKRVVVCVSSLPNRGGSTRIRLAFDAPPEFTILREEVLTRQGAGRPGTPRPTGRRLALSR